MTNQLIERYIKLRDRKADLKKQFDAKTGKVDELMTKIEHALAVELDRQGVDRMGSSDGVAFFSRVTSASVSDRDTYLNWLQTTGNWHMADVRAAKKQLTEYRDEHQDLPPGINWHEARVVRVQRA